ncbi:isoprenylcysteine carboxylmethyltransferase family protein [Phenylobacterium sp.]|uniref:methyltransferase family protein n=1 Tax=Phenylobacterium sp. TaxID=1871053 RepID=UPI002D118378|nr:isoprenylcysteine carboxylmethyltransferase family protein [Phenylobacterium sp.]HLZ75564.1 isoprenylcysteine carboxylmethyltransferase family protein [Phenylobacterium sp.]
MTFAAISGWFAARPYGLGGVALIVLFLIQSEVRFGAKARSSRAEGTDRRSSVVLSATSLVPILGFALSMKHAPETVAGAQGWMAWWLGESLPGLPASAWAAAAIGLAGLGLRLWAVLTLRERYTRTLLTHGDHAVERDGPYRAVRHPGYLGSLLCLNGIAFTSGSAPVFAASLVATIVGYAYRIRVEDRMLVDALGEPYAQYRREVRALLPIPR